jgi:hypothetical protein
MTQDDTGGVVLPQGRQPLPVISADVRERLVSGRASGTEVGALAGISRQRACKLLRRGESALQIVEARRGADGRDRYRRKGADGQGVGAPGEASEIGVSGVRDLANCSLVDLQKEKVAAEIEKRRLELDERRGFLLPRAAVIFLADHLAAINKIATRDLMMLPSLLRDQSELCSGEAIEELWSAELRRVLEGAARQNREALARYGYGDHEGQAANESEDK